MRFRNIAIPAFASFTDFRCEFSAKSHDLHIIYGPNEAGKSSMLRAIGDLLFGIPIRSMDNFLHPYKDLLIAAEIENQEGQVLSFQRSKRRASLQNHHGEPIPDDTLQPFTGSLKRDYFSAAFGLGATELAEGADQLLQGQGNIGRALFSASHGGASLIKVMESLQAEAHTIYKPRATTSVTLAPKRKQYDTIKSKIHNGAISPDTWGNLNNKLDALTDQLTTLNTELDSIDRQRKQYERYHAAAPMVARMNAVEHQLNELPDYPIVSSELIIELRQAGRSKNACMQEHEQQQARKEHLQQSIDLLTVDSQVLDNSAQIENLYRELTAYQQRCSVQLEQESELSLLESTIHTDMRALNLTGGPSSFSTYTIDVEKRLKYTEAATALQEHSEKLEALQRDLDQLERERSHNEFGDGKKDLPDPAPLKLALSLAMRVRAAYVNLPGEIQQNEQRQQELAQKYSLLHVATTDYEATASLEIPGKTTIRQFADSMQSIEHQIDSESRLLLTDKAELERLQDELAGLQQHGQLPTIEELQDARRHRDYGWSLVLNEWKDPKKQRELYSPLPLEVAFPDAILKADQIADQLRAQADLIAQSDAKKHALNRVRSRVQNRTANIQSLNDKSKNLLQQWQAAWKKSAITPSTPDEMREWVDHWDTFKQLHASYQNESTRLSVAKSSVDQASSALKDAMPHYQSTDLLALIDAAENRIRQMDEEIWNHQEQQTRLQTCVRSIDTLELKKPSFIAKLEKARSHWQSCCQSLSLPVDISINLAEQLLDRRAALESKHEQWTKLTSAYSRNINLNTQYEESVLSLSSKLALEDLAHEGHALEDQALEGQALEGQALEEKDTIECVTSMWSVLSSHRKELVQYESLQTQLDNVNSEIATTNIKLQQANSTLEKGVALLRLKQPLSLDTALDQLDQRGELSEQLQTLQISLQTLASNDNPAEFKQSVEGVNETGLASTIRQLEISFKQKNDDINSTLAEIQEVRKELRTMDQAGDEIAAMEQELEAVAADIVDDSQRYIRLRLAARFISSQVEDFRRKNQGPMLELTSTYLRRLTLGSIVRISPDFNTHDKPVLVGIRDSGEQVGVTGMSDGTRDQLYLALRLAALDLFLKEQESMPLILDDLLITFDDDRAAALLEILVDFSTRTQIFLFTHHRHVLELCGKVLQPQQYSIHHLQATQ